MSKQPRSQSLPVPAGSQIEVRGACTHNLQNVSVSIPHRALTVMTGVSGSGKSSLAFHTVFAEGQRRYLKTLSNSGQEWLNLLPRPDVEGITGLPPVISVSQERTSARHRSTVATLTEILDYLKVLYARLGVIYCPACQRPLQAQSPEQIVQQILQFPMGTKLMLLAPVVRHETGAHQQMLQKIVKEGYVRGRIDGELIELGEQTGLAPEIPHTIEIVVDRLIMKEDIQSRLAESVDQTLRLGEGSCLLVVQEQGAWRDRLFHRDLCCSGCGMSFPPIEPAMFSWSSPQGACAHCQGTGMQPVEEPASRKSKKSTRNEVVPAVCPKCRGERLNEMAASVRVQDKRLLEILGWPLPELVLWLENLSQAVEQQDQRALLQKLAEPLLYRLKFLEAVGVGYLSLDREATTLSGGELQRVRLARCLGTQLQGSCYILDEPTAGLHAEDTDHLISVLRQMTQSGNTVLCVEHNLRVIQAADYLIELGPQGGRAGGKVLFQGTPDQLQHQGDTATAKALRHAQDLHSLSADPKSREANPPGLPMIELYDANLHNLKSVQMKLPLNQITCVTGISGSGKSTLILDVLASLLRNTVSAGELERAEGAIGKVLLPEKLSGIQVVDQSPPGKSRRSCPATYSGMWDDVRRLLVRTRLAKVRGYGVQRFSINASVGTCPECLGVGEVKLKVDFLAETRVTCPLCRGKRFNPATLAVKYQGRSAAELLEMTIDEAIEFWKSMQSIQQKLVPFQQIGLGYLCLGQSSRTVSGGEAQRMKLARELAEPVPGQVLILDEPTSGLHWADVTRLIAILQSLVSQGSTVIVIEHHPLMLAAADWQIQLGPGAGEQGGHVLYCGPVSEMQAR